MRTSGRRPFRRGSQSSWIWPTVLAVLVTALNALKPVVVDDTVYLMLARHIAANPLAPYDFTLFWYAKPQPAMQVLAPPVVPYWIAGGMSLFGEHLVLLKLWLLPFALSFCHSAAFLLRRFAPGTDRVGVALLAFSPAVLPLFNFMLDIPAVALGLAAVAVFVHGCDRQRIAWALLAGLLAGLAMQAKYTMVTIPVALAWYGLLTRNLLATGFSLVTAFAVFAGWEALLHATSGVSHFLYHLRDQRTNQGGWPATELALSTLPHLGWLGLGWALFVGRAVGFGRRGVSALAAVATIGLVAVCVIPESMTVLLRHEVTHAARLTLTSLIYFLLGFAVLGTVTLAILKLGFRVPRGPTGMLRRSPGPWFLIGWLLIESAGYFALTPFPAARRIIGVCVAIGLASCALVSRVPRWRRPPRWVIAYSIGLGLLLFGIDWWDARPEQQLADRAVAAIRDRGAGRTWTQGHWGWQYYTEWAGAELIEPGRSQLKAGDWLILPISPDLHGFHRPHHGGATFYVPPSAVEPVAEFVADDWLAAQTIPNLYGGSMPVVGRDHARLRVVVYRVVRDWIP